MAQTLMFSNLNILLPMTIIQDSAAGWAKCDGPTR